MMTESDQPLIKHISDFLDWIDIEKGLSSKTQENYGRFLKKLTDWLSMTGQKSLKPHELTPEIIWNYKVYLSRNAKRELKKSTQNHYLIALRSLLNFFTDRNILSLPSDKVKLPKAPGDKSVRFLTLEQLKKLFEAPDVNKTAGLRDRSIIEVFFSTGMRISELAALNRNQLRIRPGLAEFELGIIGKGGRARTVYFSSRCIDWLFKYLGTRGDEAEALFINYRRRLNSPQRLTPRSIEKIIKNYAVISGLPSSTTPHVLRHTFATDLLSQGVDLRVVQEFLGHKSIVATQIYTHVTSKQLKDIHKKFHSQDVG